MQGKGNLEKKKMEGSRIWLKFGEKVVACGGRKGNKEKEKRKRN